MNINEIKELRINRLTSEFRYLANLINSMNVYDNGSDTIYFIKNKTIHFTYRKHHYISYNALIYFKSNPFFDDKISSDFFKMVYKFDFKYIIGAFFDDEFVDMVIKNI